MDASGKPRISRRLIQRLMAHRPQAQSAFGNTGRSRRVSDRNCDRQRIGNYRSSALGARGYMPPTSTDDTLEDHDTTSDVPLSNRTFAGNSLRQAEPSSPSQNLRNTPGAAPLGSPTGGNNITRSQPSPRFQEPPSRGYNPFS